MWWRAVPEMQFLDLDSSCAHWPANPAGQPLGFEPEREPAGRSLAPEHPFPAPLEDCLRAYRPLLKRCAPDRLSRAGDSSGASLVLSLLLLLKDQREPLLRATGV